MGLPKQVVLILAIVITGQITFNQSVPINSKKFNASTQRYLDNLKQYKGLPSPLVSTSKTNPLKQSIRKLSNGKLKNPFDYKAKNFLQKEYGFDEMQRDLLFDIEPNRPVMRYDNFLQNNEWNLNKMKRDIKIQRKLQNFENEQKSHPHKNVLYGEKKSSFNPYAVWSTDIEGFPETRYPLSITETWEPNYWDTFTNTQKKPEIVEFLPLGDIEQSKKYDDMKRASKIKINPNLKRNASLKNKKIISVNMTNAMDKIEKSSNATAELDEPISKNETITDSGLAGNDSLNITDAISQNVTISLEPSNNDENIFKDLPSSPKSDSVNSALLQLIKALLEGSQPNNLEKQEKSEESVNTNPNITETTAPLNMQLPLPIEEPLKPVKEVSSTNDNLKPTDTTTKAPATETTIIVFIPPNYYNDALSKTLRTDNLPPHNTIGKPFYGNEDDSDINPRVSKSAYSNLSPPNISDKPDIEKIPSNSMCHIPTNKEQMREREMKKTEHVNVALKNPKTEKPIESFIDVTPIVINTMCSEEEDNSKSIPNIEIIPNKIFVVTEPIDLEEEKTLIIDLLDKEKMQISDKTMNHTPINETSLQIESNSSLNKIQALPEKTFEETLPSDTSNVLEEEEMEEADLQPFLEMTQPMQVLHNFASGLSEPAESNESSNSESEEEPNCLQPPQITDEDIYNTEDESTDTTLPVDTNVDELPSVKDTNDNEEV